MNMDEFNVWSFIERQPGKMMYGVDVNDLIWKETYVMRKIRFRNGTIINRPLLLPSHDVFNSPLTLIERIDYENVLKEVCEMVIKHEGTYKCNAYDCRGGSGGDVELLPTRFRLNIHPELFKQVNWFEMDTNDQKQALACLGAFLSSQREMEAKDRSFQGHAYTLTLLKNEDWDILDGEDTQRQINFFL